MTNQKDEIETAVVKTRLQQWIDEARNPEHPNHFHANLEHPAKIYRQVNTLIRKLREETEQFDREDVRTLIGILNSGRRMQNVVADNFKFHLRRYFPSVFLPIRD